MIFSIALSIVVGAVLILLLGKSVGKVPFSCKNSLWCSGVGHAVGGMVAICAGFVFANHLAIGLIIAVLLTWMILAGVLQLFASAAQSARMSRGRAIGLSLIVILGDLFVTAPLLAAWEHFHP